jgi:hypothetical protein
MLVDRFVSGGRSFREFAADFCDAISHIDELYDGLCPVQGPGMAQYLWMTTEKSIARGSAPDTSFA